MIDHLSCFVPGGTKSEPIDDIIHPAFKHLKKVFSRRALLSGRFLEVTPKLSLEQAVNSFQFLFFPKLGLVFGYSRTRLPVLARRVAPTFDGAFFRIAPAPLQEQFVPFTAA